MFWVFFFFPFLFEIGWLYDKGVRSGDIFHFLGTYYVQETYHVLSHWILIAIPKGVQLFLLYRWDKWGSGRLGNLPKITRQPSEMQNISQSSTMNHPDIHSSHEVCMLHEWIQLLLMRSAEGLWILIWMYNSTYLLIRKVDHWCLHVAVPISLHDHLECLLSIDQCVHQTPSSQAADVNFEPAPLESQILSCHSFCYKAWAPGWNLCK